MRKTASVFTAFALLIVCKNRGDFSAVFANILPIFSLTSSKS